MADHELLQFLHIFLGKRLKGGIPVLIKERDGAVVSAILATGNFLQPGGRDACAESGALLGEGEPCVLRETFLCDVFHFQGRQGDGLS